MTTTTDAAHAVLTIVLAGWAALAAPSLRTPGPRRSLWVAMAALAVGELGHIAPVYAAVQDALGPGWPAVLSHLAGLTAAVAVVDLLCGTLEGPAWRRRANAVIGAAAGVGTLLPWVVDPPRAVPVALVGVPAYYDASWRSVVHEVAFLSYLAASLVYASTSCFRYARQAGLGRLRTGMYLIAGGTSVGFLYVPCHLLVQAAWVVGDGGAAVRFDQLIDGLTLGPCLVLVFLGAAVEPVGRGADRVRAWADRLRLARRVAATRPYWAGLVDSAPEVCLFRRQVEQPSTDPTMLRWQQTRLVTEIYEATRILLSYLSEREHAAVGRHADASGLREPDARVAAARTATRLGAQRRSQGRRPALTRPAEVSSGATSTTAAAQQVARDCRRASRRTVANVIEDLVYAEDLTDEEVTA